MSLTDKVTSLLNWINTRLTKGADFLLVKFDGKPDWTMDEPRPVVIVGTIASSGLGVANSSTGTVPTTDSAAIDAVTRAAQLGPYGSDGAAVRDLSAAPNPILHVSVEFTAGAGGAISATLLAAGGAGVKYVIWDAYTGNTITAGGGGFCHIEISDGVGWLSTGGPLPGPKKQSTANTALTVTCGNGEAQNNGVGQCNARYTASA